MKNGQSTGIPLDCCFGEFTITDGNLFLDLGKIADEHDFPKCLTIPWTRMRSILLFTQMSTIWPGCNQTHQKRTYMLTGFVPLALFRDIFQREQLTPPGLLPEESVWKTARLHPEIPVSLFQEAIQHVLLTDSGNSQHQGER